MEKNRTAEKSSQDTLRFIREHRRDDVRLLALQAHRHPTVDMPAAITQISGWQIAKEKIPAWAENEGILYPPHLSMEQCSSEMTARYKAEIVGALQQAGTFADLTGGFGIDCAFLAARFREATYVERQPTLCEIARHNFSALGLDHIAVCHDDGIRHLQGMKRVDWIFVDPARRDGNGGKTVAIRDCEPDVSALEELLLEKASHVLIKLSPMLDLALALHDLRHVQAAYVVSVHNECKELLLVLGREAEPSSCEAGPSSEEKSLPSGGKGQSPEETELSFGEGEISSGEIPIHCVNLAASSKAQHLRFTRREEKERPCPYTSLPKAYLYEPNASILKAGAFRSVSFLYNVEKLHPNSHLYTSDEYIPDFPGRKFRIIGSSSLNKKELKELQELIGAERRANLTVRNFPASVAELRKRLKLAEGGDAYLFATTLADERKVLLACRQP